MNPSKAREALRAKASILIREAEQLRAIADELFPLSDDELTERAIEEDDKALHKLLLRVHKTVEENPGISAHEISHSMGLPNNYPSDGSNYLTLQLLNHLEEEGMVSSYRYSKPYEWTANPLPKRIPLFYRVK